MSKQQGTKKKVVVNTPQAAPRRAPVKEAAGRPAERRNAEMIFNRRNYMLIALATLLMAIGIGLMSGGAMQDPNIWDEGVIYSTRRMVLAPIFMLAGLVVGIFAIFR